MSRVPAHEHETSADIRVAVTFQQHWAQQALHWVSSSCFYLRLQYGDHIPEALLERLQSAVKHTFFPNDPYPDTPLYTRHVVEHIGAVYDAVNDIFVDEPLRNAIEHVNMMLNPIYWATNN